MVLDKRWVMASATECVLLEWDDQVIKAAHTNVYKFLMVDRAEQFEIFLWCKLYVSSKGLRSTEFVVQVQAVHR